MGGADEPKCKDGKVDNRKCGRDGSGAVDGLEIYVPDEEVERFVLTFQMGTGYLCMS